MRKVKAQPLRRDKGACLLHMLAQMLLQHSLQNMRGRVIVCRCAPASCIIDGKLHLIARLRPGLS